MKLVSTAAQVRELDRSTIEDFGVPGIALMETASHAVAELVRDRFPSARQGVVVVCGGGNNGGDGYAIARWLHVRGYRVYTWSLAAESKGDAGINRASCTRMGIPELDGLGGAQLIVDAIFGTGLSRDVDGKYYSAIETMNAHPAPVVAVDIPSGIHADTGAVLGIAVRAQHTVTFARLKLGLLAGEGMVHAGQVHVADIGLVRGGPGSFVATLPEGPGDLPAWPTRASTDHKHRSGHLLVIAGSAPMAGAAVLCCQAALACGVGLVSLVATRGTWPRLAQLPPEVMVVDAGEGTRMRVPVSDDVFKGRTTVVAGPGLGGGGGISQDVGAWLQSAWSNLEIPVLFDADALPFAGGEARGPRVVTPHPGEAARMLRRKKDRVQGDRFKYASRLARDGCIGLLKGPNTLVAREGAPQWVNPTGNQTLAVGGSGDVLAGIIGALLARGVPAWDAARLGAWVHGVAADRLAARRSQGWTAGDVALELPATIEELR